MNKLWKCWEGKCVSQGLLTVSGRKKWDKKQNSSPGLQLCVVLHDPEIMGLSLMTFWIVRITQIMYAWSSITSKTRIFKSEIARKSSFPCSPYPLSFLQFKVIIIASSALFHNWFADGLAVVWGAILHHKTNHIFGRVSMQIWKKI